METSILILIYLINYAVCDEIYQNSLNICKLCSCEEKESFVMDCTNQNFQHALANWPPHNKSLIATFSNNNITTLETLPLTEHRAKLVFDHCNIQYLDSGVFANIKNVEFIDLSYNLLTTEQIAGDDFKGPYNNKSYRPIAVKYLNLAYNQIHSLPRKLFENMPELEELNLEGNDFVVLDPPTQIALSTLSKIRVLNLGNNELTELEASFIKNLHTLTELDLSSNHLDFVPISLDFISKNLKVLKLSNNYIYELTDRNFIGLDLAELYLNDLPRLERVCANTFATLKNFKKLHISNNPNLRTIDKEAFGSNQSLDELNISNNSLTEINFALNWSSLKILRIDSNPLKCSCNLYNITKALSSTITRRLDSPICTIDDNNDLSQTVYSLEASICSKNQPIHISAVNQHFDKLRISLIVLTVLLILATAVAITVAVLRYKKKNALRSYPFAAQVSYFPIQTQHI